MSKMLTEYGIHNAATRISNKEQSLSEIQTPFIASFGGDFAVVKNVTAKDISFLYRGAPHSLPIAKFTEAWNGIALLADPSLDSMEPDYKKHRKTELLQLLIKALFFCACSFILCATFLQIKLYASVERSLLLLLNLSGVFISWLLVLKHLRIQSRYADKICSLFKQSNCNSVLESSAAKLFGVVGWSEVGLGYFAINVTVLLFAPAFVYYISLINIITLPFSFWSVWYQYVKAKQWCPLCITVQLLLWSIFAVNCVCGLIEIPPMNLEMLLAMAKIGCGYIAAVLGQTLLLPWVNSGKTVENLRQTINSMKADEDVLVALLKKQPRYDIAPHSIIRFGNPNAPLQLTILSNPYCNPCARMHKKIEELLQKTDNNMGIQYFLSSFKEEWNSTNKYLIAACMAANSDSTMQIVSDWFENGKTLREEYFKERGLDIEAAAVEAEFQRHEAWKKKSQIRATPTVLVNGYKLPDNYKIEDLQHLIEFNIDIG